MSNKTNQLNLKVFINQIKKNKQTNVVTNVNNFFLNFLHINKINNSTKIFYYTNNSPIVFIITISYTKTNILLNVTNSKGTLRVFMSAGRFFNGKKKKTIFIKKILELLLSSQLSFLKNKPLALHLKNVDSKKSWLIKLFKKKFLLKSVKSFTIYPHNGCRKKKKKT